MLMTGTQGAAGHRVRRSGACASVRNSTIAAVHWARRRLQQQLRVNEGRSRAGSYELGRQSAPPNDCAHPRPASAVLLASSQGISAPSASAQRVCAVAQSGHGTCLTWSTTAPLPAGRGPGEGAWPARVGPSTGSAAPTEAWWGAKTRMSGHTTSVEHRLEEGWSRSAVLRSAGGMAHLRVICAPAHLLR